MTAPLPCPTSASSAAPAPPHVTPGSLRAWVLAARPATLPAAVVPVAVGSAVAHAEGGFRAAPAAAALAGALLLQVLANFSNDVFDFQKGADTRERLGPTRAVQAGLLEATQVWAGIGVVIALALGVGVYLTSVAGPVVIAIGLLSILAALAYTGGPYPLGYNGLGELFVLLFFGFAAVCGTTFVELGRAPLLAWACAIPVGALASAILVVNNVRDRETDVRAGKRTLAVRLGQRSARAEYVVLLSVAFGVPAALVALEVASTWALLPLLSLPLAVRSSWQILFTSGRALNRTLVGTAQLALVFGALLSVGLTLGA